MTEFVEGEAELSDGGGSEASAGSQPALKKPRRERRQKRRQQISSDEDDEEEVDDDERIREEMKGFVVEEDDAEEDGGDNEDEGEDDKSDKAGSDASEDLLEDDLELLNENMGRTKGGRVEISDDDEDDRERIRGNIFGPDEEDDRPVETHSQDADAFDDEDSRSETDSEGPFIVQDDEVEGGRRKKHKKHKKSTINGQGLDDAREVFGVENINEFYEDDEILEDEEELDAEGYPARQKVNKVSLLSSLEPSELEKGFVNAEDKKIIAEDKPERFQTRKIPVSEGDDQDLVLETAWIKEYAFRPQAITKQGDNGFASIEANKKRNEETVEGGESALSYNDMIDLNMSIEAESDEKIREALRCMRKELFEVPFIAFYRKEAINLTGRSEACLSLTDLWKIYLYDEKWCHLKLRKDRISETLKRVQQYIQTSGFPEADNLRLITERDFDQIIRIHTTEELSDVMAHFQLFYGNALSRVQEWEKQAARDNLEIGAYAPKFKLCGRTDKYQLCIQSGLELLAREFGLTPEEFSENFTEYANKNEIRQVQEEPSVVAQKYVSETFPTPEKALEGAVFLLAKQFSCQPGVRKKFRLYFRNRLKFSVTPTKKGRHEIDESHPLWNKHYIKDKPVRELLGDEYLHYVKAKNDGLLEITLYPDDQGDDSCFEYLKKDQVFYRDEYYYIVEEWNKLREEVLKICSNDILIPILTREAHDELLREAKESVLKQTALKFRELIRYGGYNPLLRYNTEEDGDEDVGIRILSICYSPNYAEACFAICIDQDGMVLDYQRLVHFTKRTQTFQANEDSRLKAQDMKELEQMILKRRPHVICLNSEDWNAVRLRQDILTLTKDMYSNSRISFEIPVEVTNNEPAKVYMQSHMATQEFPEHPPLFKQAISLARFLLDPLVEICHLFNTDNDILFLKFHPLQSELLKDELLFTLQIECINRVNELGVDINRCLEFPSTAGVLKFVCGLGPRKADHLLKMLKQNDLLESRTRLVTFCRMGPKVFMNAAGFIKIDTAKVADKTDSYVEVLDGSRVHPEYYEWARKMAVDALEIEDPADPTSALEEILQAPEKLKDLDLDAFADELNRQGYGNKSITLYDIRAELNYRYKDLRPAHVAPKNEQIFEMLIKDAAAFAEDRLLIGQILRIIYKKPTEKDFSNARGNMNTMTNTWECNLCYRDGFSDLPSVNDHFSPQSNLRDCPGIPLGARVRLEGGLIGFLPIKNISDSFTEKYRDPKKILKIGQTQYFRVIKIDYERMQIELTCKSSDLQKSTAAQDTYFDQHSFEEEKRSDEKHRQLHMEKQSQQRRVTQHPSFHNISFREAERMIRKMDQGDVIIRPSNKNQNFLSLMWKVTNEGDILQFVQVEEKEKTRAVEIGKRLVIHGEEYEDLDEIIARYVQPMAAFARDIMQFKYYMEGAHSEDTAELEKHLVAEKARIPSRIPYVMTANKKYPGKFMLSYLIGGSSTQGKVKHESMSVTPEGIRFRGRVFGSTDDLISWFKLNFDSRA